MSLRSLGIRLDLAELILPQISAPPSCSGGLIHQAHIIDLQKPPPSPIAPPSHALPYPNQQPGKKRVQATEKKKGSIHVSHCCGLPDCREAPVLVGSCSCKRSPFGMVDMHIMTASKIPSSLQLKLSGQGYCTATIHTLADIGSAPRFKDALHRD